MFDVTPQMFSGFWTRFFATIFGTKVCAVDTWAGKRTVMTAYRWRGVLHVTRIDVLDGDEGK